MRSLLHASGFLALILGFGDLAAQDTAALRRSRDEYLRAGAFERAAARDSATASYLRAIRLAPGAVYADSAAVRISAFAKAQPAPRATAAAPSPYATVLKLERLGLHTEAVEQLKALVKADPGREVPDSVRRAVLADSVGWWPRMVRWTDRNAYPVVQALIATALVIWLVYALVLLPYATPHVELGSIAADGTDVSAEGFTALVLQQVDRLTRGAAGRGTVVAGTQKVQGPVEGLSFDGTVKAILPTQLAWIQFIPGLLRWISQRPRLDIRAQLHKPGNRGLGLTIFIVRRSATVDSQTLWAMDYGGTGAADAAMADATALAEAVAIWLIFHAPKRRPAPWKTTEPQPTRVGTADWRSYALFRAGVRAADAKDAAGAERYYRRALERDPHNRGARVNLGSLLADRGETARGIAMLERARDECGDDWRDSVLYPALYRLVVIRFHMGDAAGAESEARRLVDATVTALAESGDAKLEHWHAYVRSIEHQSRVLHIGTWASITRSPKLLECLAADLEEIAKQTEASTTWYNLACAHWIIGRNANAAAQLRHDSTERVVDCLLQACETNPRYAPNIAGDPSLAGILTDPQIGARVAAIIAQFVPPPQPPLEPPVVVTPEPSVIKLLVGKIAP